MRELKATFLGAQDTNQITILQTRITSRPGQEQDHISLSTPGCTTEQTNINNIILKVKKATTSTTTVK